MTNATVTSTGAQEGQTVTVQHVDPATVLVDTNVRLDPRVDADFVASIRDLGVLVPVVAVRTADGQLRARFGHRRIAAALDAGQPTVPVVVAADEATDDAAQIERLIGQWAENEHRTGLSPAERVGVIAQLAAFGVSASKIAKRTRVKRAHVDAALTVAGSDTAMRVAEQYSQVLDLLQAATVAEFADDPEAVQALLAAAPRGQFNHVAQRLRDQRAEVTQRAQKETELREAGVTVIDAPGWQDLPKSLDRLRDADGTDLTVDNHAQCPGHAAYVIATCGWVPPVSGAPVSGYEGYEDDEENDVEVPDAQVVEDEDTEQPGEPVWASYPAVRYVCTDPKAHGHADRWGGYDSGTPRKTAAQMSDAEREAARAQRRDVIDSNKAWASAETVRREWLRTFVARKSAPKGTGGFLAGALAHDGHLLASVEGNHRTADLLGVAADTYGRSAALAGLIAEATEARAHVLALAQVLGAYEAGTDRNDWRQVRTSTTRYLRFLQAQGYALSPVELRACGENPAADQPTE